MDYTTKTIKELKELCKEKKLKLVGTKQVLIERLQQYDDEINAERKRFKVFIKTFTGSFSTIYIEPDSTIAELKQKIMNDNGTPIDKQRLYYICYKKPNIGDISYPDGQIGKQTENDKTLSYYGVNNESTFSLQVRLI